MCGRYALTSPPEAVRAWFGYGEQPNFPPRYNVAPTQPIAIVTRDPLHPGSTERHFKLVRWGFVPGFAKDFGAFPLLINARAEGIVERPSFRAAMIRRRCLVMADAWYEWRRTEPRRPGTPFLIRRIDRRPLALAGLWEPWMGADGSEIETGCIVTTSANGTLSALHPRMPVVIEADHFALWLDVDGVRPERAAALLRPAPEEALEAVEIGPAVNAVANDDPSVQQPVGAPTRVPDGAQQLRLL